MSTPWDDAEFTAMVVRRYEAGERPAALSRELGLTRNTITAKLDRLGVLNRRDPWKPGVSMGRPATTPVAPKPAPEPTAAELAGLRAPRVKRDLLASNAVNFRKPPPTRLLLGQLGDDSGVDMIDTSPCPTSAAKPWLARRFGECAYPVSGLGADVLSCCAGTDGQTYCATHRARMFAKPATDAQRAAAARARAAKARRAA